MLAVAKIVKSFGTDGGLLLSSNVDLDTLDFKEPVFITFDGLQVPFFILDCTPKGGKVVVHLNDVNNLEDAEEIVGRTIYADVELEEDDGHRRPWPPHRHLHRARAHPRQPLPLRKARRRQRTPHPPSRRLRRFCGRSLPHPLPESPGGVILEESLRRKTNLNLIQL